MIKTQKGSDCAAWFDYYDVKLQSLGRTFQFKAKTNVARQYSLSVYTLS